jgi:hypothetical protein
MKGVVAMSENNLICRSFLTTPLWPELSIKDGKRLKKTYSDKST